LNLENKFVKLEEATVGKENSKCSKNHGWLTELQDRWQERQHEGLMGFAKELLLYPENSREISKVFIIHTFERFFCRLVS
jgi:hypothetical protein